MRNKSQDIIIPEQEKKVHKRTKKKDIPVDNIKKDISKEPVKKIRKKKSPNPVIALVEDIMDREETLVLKSEENTIPELTIEEKETEVFSDSVLIDDFPNLPETKENHNKIWKNNQTKNIRKCSNCNVEKPLTQFNYQNKAKNQKMYICKDCEHEKKKDRNDKRKVLVNRLKMGNCVVCGESEPCCLDFHHIDSEHKEFTIGSANNKTEKKILQEIAKCVVVCSNCHRKIHNGLIDIFDYINPGYYKFLRLLLEAAQNNVQAQEHSQGFDDNND